MRVRTYSIYLNQVLFMNYIKTIFLCSVCMMLFAQHASSQELSGTIIDEHDEPLAGAEVYIPALHKGTATNSEGYFSLKNLPEGIYTLRFSFLGYKTESLQLNIVNLKTPLRVKLEPTSLNLQDIIVTSAPQPTDALSSSQSVVSLSKAQLQESRGSALFESLDKAPGLSTYTTGNGVALSL